MTSKDVETENPCREAAAPNSFKLSADQLDTLLRPLNPSRVQSREQGGRRLSYVEAWDIKATLIRVFGFGNFDAEVIESTILSSTSEPATRSQGSGNERYKTVLYEAVEVLIPDPEDKQGTKYVPSRTYAPIIHHTVTAKATVQLTVRDGHGNSAVYTETAAASQKGPDIGEVTDFAIKTAESDALKRAAIYLGTQFGLSLYDDGSTSEIVRVVFSPDQRRLVDRIRSDARAQAAEALPENQTTAAIMRPSSPQQEDQPSDTAPEEEPPAGGGIEATPPDASVPDGEAKPSKATPGRKANTAQAAAAIAATLGGTPVDDK